MRVTRNSLAPRLFRVLPRQPSTAALDDLEADRHAYTTTSGNGTPSGADSFLEYHVTVNESDPVSTALLRVKPYTIRGFDTAHGPSTAEYLMTADEQQGEPLPDVIYTLENHKKQLVISGVGARCGNGGGCGCGGGGGGGGACITLNRLYFQENGTHVYIPYI